MSGAPLLKRDKRPARPGRIHDKAPAPGPARHCGGRGQKKGPGVAPGPCV